jgi:membrane-associated protein
MILEAAMDFDRIAAWMAEALTRTGPFAPAILAAASFLEYVFPPFPGDLVVLFGAWYAVEGKISWPLAYAAVTGGAVLGSFVDYAAGRWLSPRLDAGAERRGPVSAERLHKFVEAYRRWGPALLLANRFLPGVRGFIFLAAGAARLPVARVLVLGAISAALWNALLLAAGGLVVHNREELEALLRRYQTAAWTGMIALAVAAGGLWAWRRRSRTARAKERG